MSVRSECIIDSIRVNPEYRFCYHLEEKLICFHLQLIRVDIGIGLLKILNV